MSIEKYTNINQASLGLYMILSDSMKRIFGLVIVCVLMSNLAQAQKGYEVGPWIGISNYFGDLNTSFRLTDVGPAAGVGARYNFGHRVCVKASLNYGYVYASDKDSPNNFEKARNLDFKSHIGDFTTTGEFNFLPYTHGSRYENFTPYLAVGFSVFYFSPFTEFEGQNYNLRPLGTEGQRPADEYNFISAGITYGGGFKWDINYDYSINIEFTFRSLFTDYLDDVSTTYPQASALQANRGAIAVELSDRSGEPKIGEFGRQRGDNTRNDQYNFLGVSVMKYFGSVQCPKISKKAAASWL